MSYIVDPDRRPSEVLRDLRAAKAGPTMLVSFVIAGVSAATTKTVTHTLGRTPTTWQPVRAAPASGVTGQPSEPLVGDWATATTITLTFPGNGEWSIKIG